MQDSSLKETQERSFISRSEYHRPRIWRSLILIFLGVPLVLLGLYMIANDLPESSVRRYQIRMRMIPTFFGAAGLIFGAFGLVTGVLGAIRKGVDAFDLVLGTSGVTVRGGKVIPWESITGVTALQYINDSKIPMLWKRGDLNCALVLHLKERIDVPGAATKNGQHKVLIKLYRYPAREYRKLYSQVIAKFRSRRIQVVHRKKHKQA